MGAIASIHFKPTKLSIQEKHNDRSVTPSYVLKSGGLGVECNRNAKEARALRDHMVEQARIHFKELFNQPFRATASRYLWSAVVNITPDTTMQELETLALRFQKRFKFQCYQIAIHRDEGHIDENGNVVINHHAHLEFVTLHPITGKSMYRREYIGFKTASYMQKLTAKVLRMKRGKPKRNVYDYQGNMIVKGTGRKRIEPRAYGRLMDQTKELETKYNRLYRVGELIIQGFGYGRLLEDSWENVCKEAGLKLYDGEYKDDKIIKACMDRIRENYDTLKADNTALKQNYKTLESAVIDLASVVDQMEGEQTEREREKSFTSPSQKDTPRKLTAKELATLCGKARKYMIGVNAELGDLKLYTQKIYMAVGELKKHRLTIAEVKTKLAEIDEQAKADYKALQDQYKDYLSPDEVEAKRSNELNRLCDSAGVGHRYGEKPFKADEALKRLEAGIKQFETYVGALCECVGKKPLYMLGMDKVILEKGIDKLKEQAGKVETAEKDKAQLEQQLETQNEAHTKAIEAKDHTISELTTENAELKTTIGELNEAVKNKDKALGDVGALQTTITDQDKRIGELESAQTAQNTAHATELAKVQKQSDKALRQFRRKYKDMKGILKQARKQHATELESISNAIIKIENLQEHLDTLTNAPQPQEAPKQEDNTLGDLQAKYDALKGQYDALKEQHNDTKELNKDLVATLEVWANDISDKDAEIEILCREIDKLEKALGKTSGQHK
ncbi:hypothetical protein [Helicobacter heilmannii]|uniref:hypothetical protein n=1 Tax=Helicobacter heilmannii TaxID=35817 RepID=UPI0006A17746|nr:hypothetical protein [Helicobacter heilmannii]CRF45604.1 mobilization protein [Helicobacter heilmannii]